MAQVFRDEPLLIVEVTVGKHDVGVLGVGVLDHLRHVEIAHADAVHDGILLVGRQHNFALGERHEIL